MKFILKKLSIFLLFFVVWHSAFSSDKNSENKRQRIVSLSPSITEILFYLGAGDQVVGVSNFCFYPKEAKKLPKMGGVVDLNIEAVLQTNPTLIFGTNSHRRYQNKLSLTQAKIHYYKTLTYENMLQTFLKIGKVCKKEKKATELVQRFKNKMNALRKKSQGKKKKKILITISSTYQMPGNQKAFIAGANNIYQEIINAAGYKNAYQGKLSYPEVSAEGLLAMNPDVIICLLANLSDKKAFLEKKKWQNLEGVNAVSNNAIYVLTNDFITLPGPRFLQVIDKFEEILLKK